jgi:hypothetical protein
MQSGAAPPQSKTQARNLPCIYRRIVLYSDADPSSGQSFAMDRWVAYLNLAQARVKEDSQVMLCG